MSTTIDFAQALTLQQAANLIVSTPSVRYMLEGEPGIGKSSLLEAITAAASERMGKTYQSSYIDVPNVDLGDIAMPVINHDLKVTEYYPNSRFKLHTGEPVVIMLDEFTKGVDPVKNMLHPLLEVANPRLGDVPVPADSIVFMTGNLSTDGVGDSMKAHTNNRVVRLRIRKPDAESWLAWAAPSGIDPVVMAWIHQYPHALASYLDGDQKSNPYIYNPREVQTAFVSPRSLERASAITRGREVYNDDESMTAALKGAIGEAAARDMQAYIDYQDQLPKWGDIIKNPTTAVVPESVGPCAVLVFGATEKVTKENMTAFMKYVRRLEPEWQATFATTICNSPTRQEIAFSSKAFNDWIADNDDLL